MQPQFFSTPSDFRVVLKNVNYFLSGRTPQANIGILLEYCSVPRTREEMMRRLQLSDRKSFKQIYIDPLLASQKLAMTIPDKPNSPLQKYVKV